MAEGEGKAGGRTAAGARIGLRARLIAPTARNESREVGVIETPTERKQGWQSFSSLAVQTGSAAQRRSRFLIAATMWCCTRGRRSAPQPLGRSESVALEFVIGDLRSAAETRAIAEQVNAIGRMVAVIHNAGVYT